MRLPRFLQPLWNAWMKVSHGMGIVMSSIILTILWATIFGLYAAVIAVTSAFGNKPSAARWWDVSDDHPDLEHQF